MGPGALRKVGEQVRARDIHPAGHTRLPRYVRGRVGTVKRIQPSALLPDTNAHFLGENPQHCYGVAFDATELWGGETEPFVLHIDLFDSYLEAPSEDQP